MGDATAGHYVTNLLASGIAGPLDWPGALRRLEAEAQRDPARRAAFELIGRMKLGADGDPLAPSPGERVSGEVDPQTEHAGLPVTKGTKYLYSRWIRESRWAP